MRRLRPFAPAGSALVAFLLAYTLAACGNIVDKDRIRIAKVGATYITRGDLYKFLRLMSPEERPHINNRGDLLKVLEKYIDDELQKQVLAAAMAEGKIQAPPEDKLAEFYDAQHPEMSISVEQLEEFGMNQADYEALQQRRQKGIDELKEGVMRREAVIQAVAEAVQSEEITITPEEYQAEYEMRKSELLNPERATFRALIFPVQMPDAGPNSAEARRRLVKGDPWDEVAKSFVDARKAIPLQTTFVNTGQPKFQSFWEQASGTQKGRVLGPMIIEDWEMMTPGDAGDAQSTSLTGYLVAEVLEIHPPSQKTLEEAEADLAPAIFFVKFMKTLREKSGVEIYEDYLPEPGMFREQTDDPLVESL